MATNVQVNILTPRPSCGCEGGVDAGMFIEKSGKGEPILVVKTKCMECGARQTIPVVKDAVRWIFEKEPV